MVVAKERLPPPENKHLGSFLGVVGGGGGQRKVIPRENKLLCSFSGVVGGS